MKQYRYKCTVAYAGAGYCGWQSQRNGTSVQEVIEKALRDLTHEKVNITASGRTDTGVNARGQVFHFDTTLHMTPRKWTGAINAYLPEDIHILLTEEVDERFHARYNVRWKRYDYRIQLGSYNVFTRDIAYQCPVELDVEAMKEASSVLIGTHDFTSLNSTTLRETPDQVRTVFDISFHQQDDILTISYTGKGFLRYMVRMMSAQLIEVGKGRMRPDDIRVMLEKRSKSIPRKNAPANGLTLEKVDYFEMVALSSAGMIREYLFQDILPESLTLVELEELVKEKAMPRYYAMTGRHDQNIKGILTVDRQPTLLLYSSEAEEIYSTLSQQVDRYLKECGIEEPVCIQKRFLDEKPHNLAMTDVEIV